MSSTSNGYVRVQIRGTLACMSALHVGDGDVEPFSQRDSRKKDVEGFYAGVCVNAQGQPFLPGSTLRGFLRDIALGTDQSLAERLFGFAGTDGSLCGAVRVYDALMVSAGQAPPELQSPSRHTGIRHGVALDPITGTAEEHKLFRCEYIPPGSAFHLEIEADGLEEGELPRLLSLLDWWDGSMAAAVGKGVSKGWGRLRCALESVKVLTQEGLGKWLSSRNETPENYFEVLNQEGPSQKPSSLRLVKVADFSITLDGPFLVNDPGYVSEEKEHSDDNQPDHEYGRLPNGHPLIPASSLRGLLRARARRIVATLAVSQQEVGKEGVGKKAEELIETLFGKTGSRCPLWISDAVSSSAYGEHNQMFNAVDRFTGGVADGKLYSARAAVDATLGGEVHLEPSRQPEGDWWKGLLLLVLRDALEGDLAVGWGKARGYGAFKLTLRRPGCDPIRRWSDLLTYLEDNKLQRHAAAWVDALHKRVKEVCAEKGSQMEAIS